LRPGTTVKAVPFTENQTGNETSGSPKAAPAKQSQGGA
jgi:hypothetical protein